MLCLPHKTLPLYSTKQSSQIRAPEFDLPADTFQQRNGLLQRLPVCLCTDADPIANAPAAEYQADCPDAMQKETAHKNRTSRTCPGSAL